MTELELSIIPLYDLKRSSSLAGKLGGGEGIRRLREYRRAIASRNEKNKYKKVRKRRKEMNTRL